MKTIMVGFDETTKSYFIQRDGLVEMIVMPQTVLLGVTKFLKEIQDEQHNTNRGGIVGQPSNNFLPKPTEPNR